ncbi:serine/threonine-protein phosphatase with EF-hands 1 isoform X3 [Dromaius novaehollandiae]|uniref:Serine/threonine-protein phosphatase n=1 Tax=Dromaius novaehollandiae TaxID=8790 RepID=A0A8C4KIH8_DRONO
MGCKTSVPDSAVKKSERVLKAAVLIQRWYRVTMARIEMRRRYSLNIFQSIEYADEQAQLQLSSFFAFMLDHFSRLDADSRFFESPSVSQVTDSSLSLTELEKRIEVPDSYYGPRLKFPLTPADASALLDAFKNEELLHARYVLQLLHETRRVLKEMPNITHLSTSYSKEITVCGDLHGKLDDLLLIFYKNGLPSEKNPYVFNGDFVDRGDNSVEILIILFAFLLIYPNDLHLNRGNHEDYVMNVRYGFTREVLRKYKVHGKIILCLLEDVFSWLPLATVVDSKVLILHGGISDTTDLDFLNLIERNKLRSLMRPPKSVTDIKDQIKEKVPSTTPNKYSAHQNISGKRRDISSSRSSPRRESTSYAIAEEYQRLVKDGMSSGLLSATSVSDPDWSTEPTQKEWQQVITIFSASNYYEAGSNRGAYIKLNPDLSPRFIQYQVSKNTCRQNLQERVSTVEWSALKALREKIYAHKTELTEAFINKDRTGTGKLSVSDWAEVMESVLCLELPWRTLRPQLAWSSPDGCIEYMTCFHNLKIGKPVEEQVQPALVETVCRFRKDLEMIFNFIDKDHSGLISLDEFHQTWRLFCVHMGIQIDNETIDKLANSIDYNKDGNIDFNEFLEAFHVVHRLDKKADE